MKTSAVLAMNVVALALIGSGAYLAVLDRTGWGWLVFAGVICARFPSNSESS